MNQSTSFAQVATNLLNVLQGYTKTIRLLLVMFVTLSVSVSAWGTTETITLTQSALGLTGSYTTDTEKTIDGVTFKYSNLMKNNDNIQAQASGGEIYNSTAIPGNIVSIAVTHSGTARSSTIYFGTSAKATTEESSTFSGTKTIEPTSDYQYFYITRGSNAAYWTKIVITYETSSGGGGTGSNAETGTINFNNSNADGSVAINSASVTGDDNLGNTWTITTVGTTSYTANASYYQVGSSSKPATSITFTTTLPENVNITSFSAKFGGFNNTAGTVTLKVGDTSVGSGSLSGTSDVTVESSKEATGKTLTVTVTGISKGVKAYYISYEYESVVSTPTYTITWKNGDAVLEMDENVEEGATPEYNGATPTKAATEQFTYTFAGWDPEISTVTKNQTYTAKFTETLRTYTITWKNGDNVLETDNNVEYGVTPQYNGATPTKAADAQYTYTFNGWNPTIEPATADATYTATFTETINEYLVTFNIKGLGTAPATQTIAYGSKVSEPSAPTADDYKFAGWYKDEQCTIPWNFNTDVITGNTAIHAKWLQIFTITWKANGLEYTTTKVIEGEQITQPAEPNPENYCGDKFVGWTTENPASGNFNEAPTVYNEQSAFPSATGNQTFYAVFADYNQQ